MKIPPGTGRGKIIARKVPQGTCPTRQMRAEA
jgi:hypothetical protein